MKLGAVAHACNFSAPTERWEVETIKFWKLMGQLVWHKETLSQARWKAVTDTHFYSDYSCAIYHVHTHSQTHERVQTYKFVHLYIQTRRMLFGL